MLKDLNKSKLSLKVHPYIAAYLTKGFRSPRITWFRKYLKWVKVSGISGFSLFEYQFLDGNQEEIML